MLESASEIYTNLHRASHLCESSVHRLKVESLIICVEGIVNPKTYLSVAFVQTDASVQCAVQILICIVLFCPVYTSGSLIVGIHYDIVQPCNIVQPCTSLHTEDILSSNVECMFRNERHVVAIVADFLQFSISVLIITCVFSEFRICISIVTVQTECVCYLCFQCKFSTYASALSCIDGPALTVIRPKPLSAKREICWS